MWKFIETVFNLLYFMVYTSVFLWVIVGIMAIINKAKCTKKHKKHRKVKHAKKHKKGDKYENKRSCSNGH